MPEPRLTMKHPDIAVTATTTKSQFEAVHKAKNWQIVDESETVTRADLEAKARKRATRKTQG